MGMFKKPSWSLYDQTPVRALPRSSQPNPENYAIVRSQQVADNLVVELVYPDCQNYEGRKILVYENLTINGLVGQGSADPHFCNNPHKHSPVIRVEPTQKGWEFALKAAEIY